MTAVGGRASVGSQSHRRLSAVRRVPDERAYLYEVIHTIGAGPDLPAILRGLVEIISEATECHACFIYFLEGDHLELRATSPMYEGLQGKVRIPVGDGLTGWVVSTRRSAFIQDNALEDPRVRRAYFPELGDKVYQSLVSVPIFGRSGTVIGAITLHAEAPHEFTRDDLDFLEHTASLIAGAVENARLYEEATARVATLSALSQLSQRIASAEDAEQVLSVVVEGVASLFQARRCEIYLLEAEGGLQLAARAPHPARPSRPDPRIMALLARACERAPLSAEEREALGLGLWGPRPAGTPLFAPLIAGEERLGALAVLASRAIPDLGSVLAAVAAHTAVALRQHQLIGRLRERNLVKDLFVALGRPELSPEEVGGLAARLGYDLDAPQLVLHVVPWSGAQEPRRGRTRREEGHARDKVLEWSEVIGQLEARLAARFPGLLFDRLERSARALLPVEGAEEEAIAALRSMEWRVPGTATGMSAGVSNPCRGASSFAKGLEEAESAAEVGGLIRGGPGVMTYEELGPYRYILRSTEGIRDPLQDRLQRLVEYDRRRSTHLLDTLEAYLDHQGNVAESARALFVHPNTLRQRLGRIERVTGLDLERIDWLSLAVATKIVKLQRLRTSADTEGRRRW